MTTPRTNGSGRGKHPPLAESVRTIERDARELLSAIEQLSASASDALREQLDQRPYAALGAGLAIGYVLGGGLSLRLVSLLAATAGRATLAQVITRSVRGTLTETRRAS